MLCLWWSRDSDFESCSDGIFEVPNFFSSNFDEELKKVKQVQQQNNTVADEEELANSFLEMFKVLWFYF